MTEHDLQKVFRVWPEESQLLRQMDLENLPARTITDLGLEDRIQPPRAIRLRLPPELKSVLKEIREATGQPEVETLLAAAREYRELHPVDPDWEEPTRFKNERREEKLIPVSYRLHEVDHEFLRNLGRGVMGVPHRTAAFEALVPIVEELRGTIPNCKDVCRVSTRLKIPNELHQAILAEVKKKHSYVKVLLLAVRAFNETAKAK